MACTGLQSGDIRLFFSRRLTKAQIGQAKLGKADARTTYREFANSPQK
jgi:hypothetical protein